jgi:hypothetical protein
MNCKCGCSSFHHLHYGAYTSCTNCPCERFTLKGDAPFVIDELFTVLDVLDEDHYWCADRYIMARSYFGRHNENIPPILVRDHEYRASECYELTDRVVTELLASHLIQGKPQWGYTDMSQLRISDIGRSHLSRQLEHIGLPIGRWEERPYASEWLRAAAQAGQHTALD